MDISVVLFEGFTPLDFTGPVEALQRIPEYSVRYFSLCGGPVGNGKAPGQSPGSSSSREGSAPGGS